MKTTTTILSVWLVATCAGLCQPESPNAASSGQKGTTVTSSLTNPLTQDGLDDGIFPAAAELALKGPAGLIPSIARVGDAASEASVQINGFPLDSLGQLLIDDGEPFATDYQRIAPIHPYFLNPGENRIRVRASSGGAIAIAQWDYIHGADHKELLRINLPSEKEQTFTWNCKVPERPWVKAARIEANEGSKLALYAETAGLHSRLQSLLAAAASQKPTADISADMKKELSAATRAFIEASELRGKPYRLIDQILEAATVRARPGDPAGSLELQAFFPPEEVELEVFAGGSLARLKHSSTAPLFAFISNLNDGPRGQTGTTILAFDAWYRQNDQAGWELDALFPRKAPGTWTQFEIGPYDLEDLFRLSNF